MDFYIDEFKLQEEELEIKREQVCALTSIAISCFILCATVLLFVSCTSVRSKTGFTLGVFFIPFISSLKNMTSYDDKWFYFQFSLYRGGHVQWHDLDIILFLKNVSLRLLCATLLLFVGAIDFLGLYFCVYGASPFLISCHAEPPRFVGGCYGRRRISTFFALHKWEA